MAKYKLTKGKHQSIDAEGNRVNNVVGDIVELTDAQFESFKDKFEPFKAEVKVQVKDETPKAEDPKQVNKEPAK